MKRCSQCLAEKPLAEFHKCAAGKQGVQPWCKPCAKAYADANRDKIAANKAAWAARNPEKVAGRWAIWNAANPGRLKAAIAAWETAHPDARRAHVRNRRARARGAGGRLSVELVPKLLALQKGKCACCFQALRDDYEMDHIVPLARGGPNTDDNIQLLHRACNRTKSAKDPIEHMQSRGFLL